MGWLIPEFTKPVTLKLSADDIKREGLGRFLTISGYTVGIIGGLMALHANPAVQKAISAKKDITTVLSPEQASDEAYGKALALIGASVGMIGSTLTMITDPKTKQLINDHYDSLPAFVKNNKVAFAWALVGLVGIGTIYLIKTQTIAQSQARYQS